MLRKGRFGRKMDSTASEYTSSIRDDVRIFEPVVRINAAHALMLEDRKIMKKSDSKKILKALSKLQKKSVDALDLKPELEDVHMAVEKYVADEAGKEVGGKLHTAKSRNDQVATAIRMTLRQEILDIQEEALGLINNLMSLAGRHTRTTMPGYTHLQVAQPTTFAHYLVAYAQRFSRDVERLSQAYGRTNLCPMGACAMAGTGFSIDRKQVADFLGFDGVVENTMDAVGSRDFALEVISGFSILMSGLGRLAEELLLWSSSEFDMIEVPDEFASTSSIMPQKKNLVVAEIARAKASRTIGELAGALALMNTLPQSYSLDLQELTPMLWGAVDQTKSTLKVMSKLARAIKPKPNIMNKRAEAGYATATDLADALVQNAGLTFRDAHAVVGRLTMDASKKGKSLEKLTIADLQTASRKVIRKKVKINEKEFEKTLSIGESVKARDLPGGPAPKAIRRQIKALTQTMKKEKKVVIERERALSKAEKNLWGKVGRRAR
jgi:argininosuccinate lyase